MAKEEQAKLLEMSIDSIRVNLATYQRAVVLRVKETKRYLPVWIGPSEADSIAMKLRNITLPRPMTHDLLHSIIVEDLDTSVTRVIVSRLEQTTFYAQIVLQRNGTTIERDCRPSDGIALAVRTGSPIYASEDVVAEAGIDHPGEDIGDHLDITITPLESRVPGSGVRRGGGLE